MAMRTSIRSVLACLIFATAPAILSAYGQESPGTLEDIYGDSGNRFQAAIGIRNEEKDSPDDPDPARGFGLSVDDVVMQWREFELIPDRSECGISGECAVLDVSTIYLFEGRTVVPISVLDKTPDRVNDCDLDGVHEGGRIAPDDCDGDGRRDVVVRARSQSEPTGEIVFLNRTDNTNEYRGELPISTFADAPGTLWVKLTHSDRTIISITYHDRDDGTGRVCQNSVNPLARGWVKVGATVFGRAGSVMVAGIAPARLTDNGDNDGFPDTHETVAMQILVTNLDSEPLEFVRARVSTRDPTIDCILNPAIFVAARIGPRERVLSQDVFVFKVSDVDRTALGFDSLSTLTATFDVFLTSDRFDVSSTPQRLVLDLDLDVRMPDPKPGKTTFFEGFESSSGFGQFTTMNLDAGRADFALSDGYRCQYHDPDWIGSNSYGQITDCFLGSQPALANAFFWQVHKPSAIDGGRAYSGTQSLYMGIFGPAPDEHTTPMATLEAVGTTRPIHLDFATSPELSFKHQISLLDYRGISGHPPQTADRGVVQLQLADALERPVGKWIKLTPYLNTYRAHANDGFSNCTFDPIDDGNDEDDFFVPTDPDRRLGPSSTCYAGGFADDRVFAQAGDTFHPFDPKRLGQVRGPGLEGALGLGTWVDSRVSLDRFRGRSVRLRFLTSSLKVGAMPTWETLHGRNPTGTDDGWWIDDVTVDHALTTPVEIVNDDKDNSGLPACGARCTRVVAALTAEPMILPAPGRVVALSAATSMADRCSDGILQFQFWIDGDGDRLGGSADDTLLRGWTDNPTIVDAPLRETTYVTEVRCSTVTTCGDVRALTYSVNCPSSGRLGFPEVRADNSGGFSWGRAVPFDFAKGRLDDVQIYTASTSGVNQGPASSFDPSGDHPSPSEGFWYLFRESGALRVGKLCNDPGISWGTATRDSALP